VTTAVDADLQPAGSRSRWACVAILAAAVVLFVYVRAPLLSVPLERDEGEYAYIAQRVLAGDVPYRDAFDQKPPGIFLVYVCAFALLGESIEAIHLFLYAWTAATAFALFGCVRLLAGPLAAAFAVLVFATLSGDPVLTANAANTEMFLLLPMVASVYCMLRALAAGPQLRWWVLCGALAAAACWFKRRYRRDVERVRRRDLLEPARRRGQRAARDPPAQLRPGLQRPQHAVHRRHHRQQQKHFRVGRIRGQPWIATQRREDEDGESRGERARQQPDATEERERGHGGPGIHEEVNGFDRLAQQDECARVDEKDAGRLLVEGVAVGHVARQDTLRDIGVLAFVALQRDGDQRSPHEDEQHGRSSENRSAAPPRTGSRGRQVGVHSGRHGPRSSMAGNASLFVPKWRKRRTRRLRGACSRPSCSWPCSCSPGAATAAATRACFS